MGERDGWGASYAGRGRAGPLAAVRAHERHGSARSRNLSGMNGLHAVPPPDNRLTVGASTEDGADAYGPSMALLSGLAKRRSGRLLYWEHVDATAQERRLPCAASTSITSPAM